MIGRRPPGSASPVTMSTRAFAISWPPNHACTTAPTSSTQSMVTGAPVLTTTTVFGLAAATRRTSSSCSPGRSIDSRSRPSLSHSALLPTTTIAASALDAIAAARSSRSATSGRRQPIRTPRMIPGPVAANSAARSTDWPATRSSTTPRSSLAMPNISRPGGGGSVTPSNTRSPSMMPRLCPPIWVNVNVCAPDSSAVKRARTRIDIGSALPPRSPRMTTLPSSTCRSCGSPANSAFAKSSTAMPGRPSGVGDTWAAEQRGGPVDVAATLEEDLRVGAQPRPQARRAG